MSAVSASQTNVLYLAPWVDLGGTDKGTIDWFRCLDRYRFRASLITTQPSANRRLGEVLPWAEEVWPLPDLMAGRDFAPFIFDFVGSRRVDVLHVMNSRIGYDVLPDLRSLPDPPAVVVQLHVEEQDRSGYVRYVATRYGNLVDAYSVTSRHLAEAMLDYDAAPAQLHVIPTGVDAEREFNPQLAQAVSGLEPGPVHILVLGRLAEQKDPLLMLRVAGALRRATEYDFRVHVVGDGPLESTVREAVGQLDLEDVVEFHGPTTEPAAWYAACDLLLLTSGWEGVPYVAYEALAMGIPVVAPDLPGMRELIGEEGELVGSRDPAAFVEPLRRLIYDADARRRIGEAGRRRMRERFAVRDMAAEHEALYERLMATRRRPRPARRATRKTPPPIRFRSRSSRERPPVSIVIPCFNHGRYLPAALDSIASQSYPEIETVVVDDASTDPDTLRLLDELDHRPALRVIRSPQNRGPSAARNAALEVITGRYVLPVDADNRLLPSAVEALVAQLAVAGEKIGFIYPNQQFFGSRTDYFQPPAYNLANLLLGNYCDTCSLLDRAIFDAGVRFPEDIRLGHEDWDFALTLAEREVYGEAARERTVLVRKHGFTRSDEVEYGAEAFAAKLPRRHPRLYGSPGRVTVHARWAPALSLLALEPFAGAGHQVRRLERLLRAQTCRDAEVLVRTDREFEPRIPAPALRRTPSSLSDQDRAAALEVAIHEARGRELMATELPLEPLLADPAVFEKVLRVFKGHEPLAAIAFADLGEHGGYPFRLLEPDEADSAVAHTLAVRAQALCGLPHALMAHGGEPIDAVAQQLAPLIPVEWRHLPGRRRPGRPHAPVGRSEITFARPGTRPEAGEQRARLALPLALPEPPRGPMRRLRVIPTWTPPLTVNLCRHRRQGGEERVVNNSRLPPPGYELEYDLGLVQRFPVPGTRPLLFTPNGPSLVERGEASDKLVILPHDPLRTELQPDATLLLGHLEQAPLPMLDSLQIAWDPASESLVLVAFPHDPMLARVERAETIGFLESFPLEPREPPSRPYKVALVGLLRSVDLDGRRHRYAVGRVPPGRLVGELGALWRDGAPGLIPLRCDPAGNVWTDDAPIVKSRPTARTAMRWVGAPLGWHGVAPVSARARASARRMAGSVRARLKYRADDAGPADTVGWLLADDAPGCLPLYSAVHPVTGDQLLTRSPIEATDMGYHAPVLLGYLRAVAPETGALTLATVGVPWASRFGLHARGRSGQR